MILSSSDGLIPRTVWLKGYDVSDYVPVLELMRAVARVFDAAYGQVNIFDDAGDSTLRWTEDRVVTYKLRDQQVWAV